MTEFKNSILALMQVTTDFRKISKVTYSSPKSLLLSYDELVCSTTLFANKSISYIDDSNMSSVVNSECNSVSETYLFLQNKSLVKITDIEDYNSNYVKLCNNLKKIFKAKKVDCHIYFGKKGSPSFDFHKDPMQVLIGCLDGKKEIKFKRRKVLLDVDDWVYIPANTNHKAYYTENSITVSFGIYK